jgi:hypothetical protein
LVLHSVVVGNSPLAGNVLNVFLFFVIHNSSLIRNILNARLALDWLPSSHGH